MMDPQMTKDILQAIGDGQYVGTSSESMVSEFIGGLKVAEPNDREKFIYHMNELFDAGLYKSKSLGGKYGWGLRQSIDGGYSLADSSLVLTPLGGEALDELSKPRGFERFKGAIRSVGTTAGSEAVKYAIGKLLKG